MNTAPPQPAGLFISGSRAAQVHGLTWRELDGQQESRRALDNPSHLVAKRGQRLNPRIGLTGRAIARAFAF